jgi:hypothetical protein
METEGKTEEGPGIALSCRKLPRGAASLGAPWGYFRQWGFQRAHFHVYLHACYESLAKKMGSIFQIEFLQIIHLGSGPAGSTLDVSIQVSAAVGCK